MTGQPGPAGHATPADPLRRLTPVVRIAPAKVNLTLAVVGRRDDGYHTLHSVFVPLTLADRLSLAPAGGDRDTLHVDGLDAGPPGDNLVLRALAAARAAVGRGWSGGSRSASGSGQGLAPALAVRLEKRIPVAAGLGGGSSDAAATLDGALEAWAAELDDDARLAVAARLGSDVPFFLVGGPALIEGRGERVAPLDGLRGTPGVVLVTPVIAVATPDVFAAFDAIRSHGDGAVRLSSAHLAEELRNGLTADNLVARAGVLASANDLLPATSLVVPELVPFKRALSRLLKRPIGLSGSGPTLWALYPSESEAVAGAAIVRAALAGGGLVAPGPSEPFVCASTIVSRHEQRSEP
jgi:4-diphosphocytidyl-2-C-methyl-D-erythritol kinase